jgi:ribokinase
MTITVVGSINLDLIAHVERLPARGETVAGDRFISAPGGKGANQALAARRAGAPVRMVGAVGRDSFAGDALASLQRDGVDLTRVAEVDARTGTALIMVEQSGENIIAVVAGANAAVEPSAVAALDFAAGEHVLLQHEIPLSTVEATLDAARAAGAVTLLNTAPYVAEAVRFVDQADYIIANETELDHIVQSLSLEGDSREARMQSFARRTGRTLVVSLGAAGVAAARGDEVLAVPALKVVAIDTVGAGDTFCGYLAASLSAGMSLETALKRAAVAGSLACLKPGAQPSIPSAAEVDAAVQ